MGTIGDNAKLKALVERAQRRPKLPSASDVSKEMALALVESCRQGTAPIQGALVLAVGREDLINSMKQDLIFVANGSSCLRVVNGVFGMGKTFTLRVLQEYAHREGFATSFLTLSSRECPMDNLKTMYRNIVKGIRTAGCIDRPALEDILVSWALKVREDVKRHSLAPWVLTDLDAHVKNALTQYYEGVHSVRSQKVDLALRWLQGETTMTDAKHLGMSTNISSENALKMLGNLTRMLRHVSLKGLVTLLDEADAIPSLPSAVRREEAYMNLYSLATAASSTPYSYFVYATTPAFFKSMPSGFDKALENVTELHQLESKELIELAEEVRDLHFKAYDWGHNDFRKSSMRLFARRCASALVSTPRDFVRALVITLDVCQENKEMTLEHATSLLKI
jgi:hypothetical protein